MKGSHGRRRESRRQFLARIYGNHCAACKVSGKETDLTIDHVVPYSKGGANAYSNLQLLCGPCNMKKGATVEDHRPGRRMM